jgi:uncharacterized repeat protein (TIGR03803 family)
MRQKKFGFTVSGILVMVLMLSAGAGAADTYKVLYRFTGNEGATPLGVIFDAAGNLYGTTYSGFDGSQYGVVFKLAPNSDGSWTESTLYAFTGPADGSEPYGGPILDAAGNLYGTTSGGGIFCGGGRQCGTVFKLTPNSDGSWTESLLHSFTGGADGVVPFAGLILDAAGNLYGTTVLGGGATKCFGGCGTVFKLKLNLDGSWTESVLYSFTGGEDGWGPEAGLIFDTFGNLYGTTSRGGHSRCKLSYGTVFELTPNPDGSWKEKVLHSFNATDGSAPVAGLILDAAGALYGTTFGGGNLSTCDHNGQRGYGVVFKLTPKSDGTWKETVLHTFTNHPAANPLGGLIFDTAGNLYGTTTNGGPADHGAIFKLTPNSNGGWGYSVLRVFQGKPAANPFGSLVLDKAGNVYGTTENCGELDCYGTVFEFTP